MSITSESLEMMMLKNGEDSSSRDDANSRRNFGGTGHLKKGPWTSVEDAILVEYVTNHGEGNWNAVQKHSGLARCGKSCRLRWANHLRPDLKKGAFTPEEEQRIIELHAKMGNKWAQMAAELPGRTDNEIKNYWNTRIKRRQRAGLPIYPPDLCLQASNEDQLTDDINAFSSGDMHHPDLFPIDDFEIPAFEIKNLELNQQLYPPAILDISISSLLDIPTSSLLTQGLHPSYPNTCLDSRVHPPKRFRGPESSFYSLNAHHITEPFMLFSAAYDNNNLNSNHGSCSSVLSGSHAATNGNTSSSSEPNWAMKLELPSLQTQTGSWGGSPSSSPLPSPESVDTLIQTLATENVCSRNLSPRNSGLLDAVLYESQTLRNTDNNTRMNTSSLASDMVVDEMDETEWEGYGEPISPWGHSTASVFSEGTPMSGNSVDESQSVQHTTGCKVQEASSLPPIQHHNTKAPSRMIFYRPDLMLGSSNYFFPGDHTEDHTLLKDASSTWNAMSTI